MMYFNLDDCCLFFRVCGFCSGCGSGDGPNSLDPCMLQSLSYQKHFYVLTDPKLNIMLALLSMLSRK